MSVQIAVEMPFDIKTIESPTHKIKLKVSRSVKATKMKVKCIAPIIVSLWVVIMEGQGIVTGCCRSHDQIDPFPRLCNIR